MKAGEGLRWLAALAGVSFWLAIPLIVREGGGAKHAFLCRDRAFTGQSDHCFNDYLPVLETVFIPFLILLTLYPFARFAFSLYSPPSEGRRLKWRLGTRDGGASAWPVLQAIAAAGAAWAAWRMLTYPLATELWPFHLYWGAFAAWFGLGALVGLRDERRASSA